VSEGTEKRVMPLELFFDTHSGLRARVRVGAG
jgi:hypothetical protein